MKKVLVILVLVACVTAATVGGTLAVYNKDITAGDGIISAKEFYIGADGSAIVDTDMAPGESGEWNFTVTNTAEGKLCAVDMNMTIKVVIKDNTDATAIQNLTVKLVDKEGNTLGEAVIGTGNITFALDNAFVANTAKTLEYKIVIEWPISADESDKDTADGENGASSLITVSVTGTQA